MALLLIADDAYVFMVAWEVMTLAATLLVIANHRMAEVRRAGFLYLLISHVGALALLLCFGLLQADTGDYTFTNTRKQHFDLFWASIAFFLVLFGFGAKAGILLLHIWPQIQCLSILRITVGAGSSGLACEYSNSGATSNP